jgi:hypothetical protein
MKKSMYGSFLLSLLAAISLDASPAMAGPSLAIYRPAK